MAISIVSGGSLVWHSLAWLRLSDVTCSAQSPADEERKVKQDRESRVITKRRRMLLGRFLLDSHLLFIYLRARKRGFSHDPSGMALSHGGLGPVSRIWVEDGGAPTRHQTGPGPVPPTPQTPRAAKTNPAGCGGGHGGDNKVRMQTTVVDGQLCDNASNIYTHIYLVTDIMLLYCCLCAWTKSRFRTMRPTGGRGPAEQQRTEESTSAGVQTKIYIIYQYTHYRNDST